MNGCELDRQLTRYYREVGRKLVCSRRVRRQTLEGLRAGIEEYREANPKADFSQVVRHFGTADFIADNALATLSPAQLRRYTHRVHMLQSILLLFVTAFFFWGVCTLFVPALTRQFGGLFGAGGAGAAEPTLEVFNMSIATMVWLGLMFLFVVVEAATVGLVSIWFAVGALVALLLSTVVPSVYAQVTVFVVVTALALLVTRPLVKKHVANRRQGTNSELNVGRKAQVIAAIDPHQPGRVRLDGVDWSARADVSIPVGSWCVVAAVESATLVVQPERKPATV